MNQFTGNNFAAGAGYGNMGGYPGYSGGFQGAMGASGFRSSLGFSNNPANMGITDPAMMRHYGSNRMINGIPLND